MTVRTRNTASQSLARKRTVAKRGERCEKCGSRALIELHHKVEAKNGGTFADDNCILLCWLCHQKAHGNKPGRKGLTNYNATRVQLGEIRQ
jgi:5-methylcytosine-specific restriction endonuclease McrA